MNSIRGFRLAILLAGVAGHASAQEQLAVTTSPTSPTTYGQAVTLVANAANIYSDNNCSGASIDFFDNTFSGAIGSATTVQTTFLPAAPTCLAILPPNAITSSLSAGTHSLSGGANCVVGVLEFYECAFISPTNYTLVVTRATPALVLGTAPNPSIVGQSVTVTATLSAASSTAAVPTGTVNFYEGIGIAGISVGSASVTNGVASVPISGLNVGAHTFSAAYSGDSNYAPSSSNTVTQTVNPQPPTTIMLATSPNPSTTGQTVTLMVTVTGPGGTPTGNVSFSDNGGFPFLGPVSLSNGTARAETTALAVGIHHLTASYGGDLTYQGSSSNTVNQTVNQIATNTSLQAAPNPSTFGQIVVLTAAVSPSTAAGTVTFKDGSNTIGTQSLNNGAAVFSTSSLSVGSHSLNAFYGGDTNDMASVSPTVTESVGQTITTTALAVAPNPSAPGQNVTLTATVTPASATGNVSFFDGANLLGAGSLSNGVATLSTTSLSTGTHSLTASYAGDTNDASSVSSSVTLTVGQQTTTTMLASAPNPSNPGQNVTLTATVTPSNATGTVSFFDAASLLGSGTLNNGVATFSTTSLSASTHSLTASYGGDTNNTISTSPTVNQSVTAAGGGSITSLVPATVAAGSAAFTLTVNGTGFSSGAVVQWNGSSLGTTFVSATQVTAAVPANLIGSPGMVTVTVVTGGGTTGGATFLIGPAGSPEPVSVTPSSGSGTTQSFSFQFSDPAGYQTLGVVNMLINNFLDGRSACYLAYVVASNTLVLVDDGGDPGGPYAGSVALGSSAAIQNSQCAVNLVSAVGNGNTVTLTLDITFKPAFGGSKIVYMAARDLGAGNSNWQALGVWQVTYTPQGTIVVTGLTPVRGAAPSGTSQEFILTLTDSQGASDFGVVNVLINNFIDGRQACYLAYVASTNTLILIDDAGDAAGPYAGTMALSGGSGNIQNSQCMVSGAGSGVNSAANTLTLTLNITFKAAFAGNRVIYAAGRDSAGGNNTDWQAVGTTTVQ